MYEVSCGACQASFNYNREDYIHLCPFCSTGFVVDSDDGSKELIGDHYIIPTNVHPDNIGEIFRNWIKERYHHPLNIDKEFSLIGYYGVMMPYWVISLEAHTYRSGHSNKEKPSIENKIDSSPPYVREEGRFSKRYRWASIARKSAREHWGLDGIHNPREKVAVDWDGFPLDESLGVPDEGNKPIYEAKLPFKFDLSGNLTVIGVQVKESHALMRVKDQVTEYHRRIAKTKIGSMFEHRTEIEIIGIHLVHMPFWFVRYAYNPIGATKYLSKSVEKKVLIHGYTKAVLEAELPIVQTDKVMINLIFCSVLAFISLTLSVLFFHPLFYIAFTLFIIVVVLSGIKIKNRSTEDSDFIRNKGKPDPAF